MAVTELFFFVLIVSPVRIADLIWCVRFAVGEGISRGRRGEWERRMEGFYLLDGQRSLDIRNVRRDVFLERGDVECLTN